MSIGGQPRRIIVVRKKSNHQDEHHGGSWKVAYADFVTAMMAFFLVLWILGMEPEVKDLVQGYFSNPVGYRQALAVGGESSGVGVGVTTLGMRHSPAYSVEEQRSSFEATATSLSSRLQEARALSGLNAEIEVVVTDQGLRIELMDTGSRESLFPSGSAVLRPELRSTLLLIAGELRALPNGIVVEGHTDARPFGNGTYSNWELSVDRANAARRALLQSGVLSEGRILEVRGHATRAPRVPDNLLDPTNRRISILVPFAEGPDLRPLTGIGIFPGSPATAGGQPVP